MKNFILRLLAATCCTWAIAAHAAKITLDPPPDVPVSLGAHEFKELTAKRNDLLTQFGEAQAKIDSQARDCHEVAEDSPKVGECRAKASEVGIIVKNYRVALEQFNHLLTEKLARARDTNCEAVARQAEQDRAQIERQRRTNEASQEELAEWSKLNEEAQKKAVEAALMFTLNVYAANVDNVRKSLSKLERHADYLAKMAKQSRKLQARTKYLARLDSTLGKVGLKWVDVMGRTGLQHGLDIEEAWSISRDTMHHEFRVASKHNEAMREALKDPGFKEAFTGDDIDTPGMDVLTTLTDHAVEELGKFELGLQRYEKFTGPTIRAAVFVRDAAYSALLSTLSTQRVLQQNDLAGEAAKAARALQLQYQKSVDALHACRAGGSAKPSDK